MDKALLELLYMEMTLELEWMFSCPVGCARWGVFDGFRV